MNGWMGLSIEWNEFSPCGGNGLCNMSLYDVSEILNKKKKLFMLVF